MVLIDVHGQVDIDRFIILYSQSDIHRDAVNGRGPESGCAKWAGALGLRPRALLARLLYGRAGSEEGVVRWDRGPPLGPSVKQRAGLTAKLGAGKLGAEPFPSCCRLATASCGSVA